LRLAGANPVRVCLCNESFDIARTLSVSEWKA
jgi:hypothetical protein